MIDYDKIVAITQETIDREQAAFTRTKPHVEVACRIANQYMAKRPDDGLTVAFSPIFDRADIYMYLDNLRDVAIILRLIGQAGYRRRGQPRVDAHAHGFSYVIDPESNNGVEIQVTAIPSGKDGATCRQVQVGTKVVPVYEIQCAEDGQVQPAEEPEPA